MLWDQSRFYLPVEISWRGHAIVRIISTVHSLEEDVLGAVDEGLIDLGPSAARLLAYECLGVSGMKHGGIYSWSETDVTIDPWRHSDSSIRDLATEVLELAAAESNSLDLIHLGQACVRLVAATEDLVDYPGRIPRVREPEQVFEMIRVARNFLDLMNDFGLPSVLPADWTS